MYSSSYNVHHTRRIQGTKWDNIEKENAVNGDDDARVEGEVNTDFDLITR